MHTDGISPRRQRRRHEGAQCCQAILHLASVGQELRKLRARRLGTKKGCPAADAPFPNTNTSSVHLTSDTCSSSRASLRLRLADDELDGVVVCMLPWLLPPQRVVPAELAFSIARRVEGRVQLPAEAVEAVESHLKGALLAVALLAPPAAATPQAACRQALPPAAGRHMHPLRLCNPEAC